ncbi:MAG: hypothetical protein R6V45_04010 [Oceanipulchritudo sp.]
MDEKDQKPTPESESQAETNPPPAQAAPVGAGMDPKVVAILSYITVFGWIAAVILNNPKKPLASFHVRQMLCIMLAGLALMVVAIIPILGWIIAFVGWIVLLVFWIMGLINAIQGKEKPLPLIGERSQEWFKAL